MYGGFFLPEGPASYGNVVRQLAQREGATFNTALWSYVHRQGGFTSEDANDIEKLVKWRANTV